MKLLPNLVTIARGVSIPLGSLQNLESLSIDSCHNMKHVLPIRLLVYSGLLKLQGLKMGNCEKLEVVFNVDNNGHDDNEYDQQAVVVHNVNIIKIAEVLPKFNGLKIVEELPKLSSFLQGSYVLEWPSELWVEGPDDLLKSLGFSHDTSGTSTSTRPLPQWAFRVKIEEFIERNRRFCNPTAADDLWDFVYPALDQASEKLEI